MCIFTTNSDVAVCRLFAACYVFFFASICYFIITRHMFTNVLFIFVLNFYFCIVFCCLVYCFPLLCSLFPIFVQVH